MLKLIMKIVLTPFMLVARLMLGLAAFITSIASTIIGLTVTVFLLLGVVEFTILNGNVLFAGVFQAWENVLYCRWNVLL